MNKDSLSDERLALLHQQKRVNAFFILYKRYRNYGYAVIYSNLDKFHLINALKDEKDAILYEGIMEALARFDQTRGTFRKLLAAILSHQTLNCIREFKQNPLSDYVSLDANFLDGSNLVFADSLFFADKSATPQDIINVKDHTRKVEINYSGLYKRRVKKMIRLKKDGYSYEEIAKKLNTTEKAVRSIFYRIKRRIDIKDSGKIKK